MQELATDYLGHFSIDLEGGSGVDLDESAPQDLRELAGLIEETHGPGNLPALFEALSIAADSEMPFLAEVDEKVCPLDIYYVVLDFLSARAFPTDGGD